ncbi:MAG: DUF1844 domain-containing protein [Bdellovibrionota bacterium]
MTDVNFSDSAKVDFNGLILGFSSAALYYLGQAPIEGHEINKLNLDLAKQNIEIISLLKEKTKGNLNTEEEKLINEVLTDLTKKYDVAKQHA